MTGPVVDLDRLGGDELRLSARPTDVAHLEAQRRCAVGAALTVCKRRGFTTGEAWTVLDALGLCDTAVGMVEAARDARKAVQEPGVGTNTPALVSGELHAEDSTERQIGGAA